jgi:uncharacterized membrane protein
MATLPQAKRLALPRSRWFIWGIVVSMILYVLNHNERFIIDHADPYWQHIESFKWWLLPHGLAGACAILLGPMQFSDRLRQRFTKLHRVVGRVYVCGAFIVAPIGVYIQYVNEHLGATRTFTIATAVDATLLVTTTAIAFYFAMKRKIQLHRQWMTRSYAVAIVFLEVRVISGLGGWDDNVKITEAIVWGCIACSLLLADIVLQWQELRRTRPIAAAAKVAS